MQTAIMGDVVDKVMSDVEAQPRANRPRPEPIQFHARSSQTCLLGLAMPLP